MKENVNSFIFGVETKPIDAINNLIDKLSPYGDKIRILPHQNFMLSQARDKAFIILLNEGCFSLYHKVTNLRITTLFSPSVVGLIDGYGLFYDVDNRPQHFIKAETLCVGWSLPLDVFVEKCDEETLWHDIAKILAHRLIIMSAREEELVGNDAYSKIKSSILELWQYPDYVRMNINLAHYIQDRTGLSRSRVMDILSHLKEGAYIEITAGKLVAVGKLPKAY